MVLGGLLGALIMLSLAFEVYFRLFECEVDAQYMAENGALARRALSVLAMHNIPAWLDYATLLNNLREQQLNRWEQDVDLSVLDPVFMPSLRDLPLMTDGSRIGPAWDRAVANPTKPGLAISREHLFQKMRDAGFTVTYDEPRQLVQLWGPNSVGGGPHVDLWLWAPIPAAGATADTPYPTALPEKLWTAADPPVLATLETAHFRPRPLGTIFPLQTVSWLGMKVWAPAKPHEVAKGEFGRYGGSYMVAQVFRGDCFHNFFQLRFAY